MSNRPSDLTFASYLAGGLIGVVIALLVAPHWNEATAHRRRRKPVLADPAASPHGAAGRSVQEPAFAT